MGKRSEDIVCLKEYLNSRIDALAAEKISLKEYLTARIDDTIASMKLLKEFFGSKIDSVNAETKIRHDGLDTALRVAKVELEGRLLNLNELRKEVVDDRVRLIGKDVYFAHIEAERKSTEDILRRVTILETRSVTWSAAIMLSFVIAEVLMRIFHV